MVYLFDIDGTLTFPRQKMEDDFASHFLKWMEEKKVFFVAGSDKEDVEEQIPNDIIEKVEGIFCCMGNEFWQNGKLVYKNDFAPPEELLELLEEFLEKTPFDVGTNPSKREPFFEERAGMLNFATVGRNASTEERGQYNLWDSHAQERAEIAREIEERFPDLEARLGGQISIDIQPKGHNKSQASKWVRENLQDEMCFFGDKCEVGGNDRDIYLDIIDNGDGSTFHVKDSLHTYEILRYWD